MARHARYVFAALGGLILLAGCAHKFTRPHFDLIQTGATQSEVRQLLGKPSVNFGDHWFYDELDRHYTGIIYFDAEGRVQNKEWMNAKTGEWLGQNPHANPPPAGEVRETHTKTTRIDED
jgi:outer membrane protein assembly factor BamE (lipoprotein component of BamABCDE complex)